MGAEPTGAAPHGTALVTGVSGGLGARAVAALRAGGWRVRALVHRRAVEGADEEVLGDLADSGSLAAATAGATAVLHLAALTHARRLSDYERSNVGGTRRLLDAAATAGVGRFVFVSSRTAVAGAGAYGESKLAAEEEVRASGLPHVILRPAEVYGAGAREGIDDVIERARRGAPVPLVGRGADRVCPLHVDDLIPALVAAMSAEAALGRTYVLGGPCMSLRELAELCIDASGYSSRIVSVPLPVLAAAARLSAFFPLPLYPDQLERLRAPKPAPSPEAVTDLGFRPRPLGEEASSHHGM